MLEEGRYRSAGEIAEAEGVTRSFVNRLLRLTLLAPDIVEAILDGWQPKGMALEELTRAMPSGWEEQRQVTCRPQSSNEKPSERRKRRGGFAPRSAAAVLSATP
jgi:ParB-like chromosome segregation protein Spo0J